MRNYNNRDYYNNRDFFAVVFGFQWFQVSLGSVSCL